MTTTIYIKKTPFGWSWNDTLTAGYSWHSAPTNIKTHSDLITFFRSGGHRGQRGANLDAPALVLVNDNNQVMKHYNVKLNHATNLHTAAINFDDSRLKSFTTADFWSEDDQLKHLRRSAVDLPSEHSETLSDAVNYLKDREPFTITEYREALTAKIKDGITTQCQQHAAGTPAVIEFTD